MSRVDGHQHQIATQNVCRDVTETSTAMNRIPLFEAHVKLTVRCISPAATQDSTSTRHVTLKHFIGEGSGPQNHAKTHNHLSANAQNRKPAEVHNRKNLLHSSPSRTARTDRKIASLGRQRFPAPLLRLECLLKKTNIGRFTGVTAVSPMSRCSAPVSLGGCSEVTEIPAAVGFIATAPLCLNEGVS